MALSVGLFVLLACGMPPRLCLGDEAGSSAPPQAAEADAAPCPNAAAPVRTVGDAGDLRRVELVGIRQCDPVAVRRAMQMDLPLQAAARPSAPLCDFLATLKERLTEGYRHSGFADAVVDVTYDPVTDAVSACIHEGQLYTMRDIRVTGGTAKVRNGLVARLTEPEPARPWSFIRDEAHRWPPTEAASSEPLWRRGEALSSLETVGEDATAAVRRWLADLGYPAAEFTVDVPCDKNRARADLVIGLSKMGPAATVGEITLIGLTRHTREQVLNYLEISPGDPVNSQRLAEIHAKLRTSCRFWSYSVLASCPVLPRKAKLGDALPVELVIDILEYDRTPPLDEPLDEIDQALVRVADWLQRCVDGKHGDAMLVLKSVQSGNEAGLGQGSLKVTMDHRGRAAVSLTTASDPDFRADHAILLADGQCSLYDWRNRLACRATAPWQLTHKISLRAAGIDDDGFATDFSLSWGMRTSARFASGDGEQSGCPLSVAIEPVAMVNAGRRPGVDRLLRDGMLVVSSRDYLIEADAASGRVRRIWFDAENHRCELAFQAGALKKVRSDLQSRGNHCAEQFDSDRPLGSVVVFLARQILDQPIVQREPLYELLARQAIAVSQTEWFLRQATGSGIDRILARGAVENRIRYHMPSAFESRLKAPGQLAESDYWSVLGLPQVSLLADSFFPRGSWPWTFSRESAFYLADRINRIDEQLTVGADGEFQRINADDSIGPIGQLVLGELGDEKLSSEALHTIAKVAAPDSSGNEQFSRDVQLALYGDHGLAQVARTTFETYAAMDPKRRQRIGSELPQPWGVILEAAAAELRRNPDAATSQAIEAAFSAGWARGMLAMAETEQQQPDDIRQARGKRDEMLK
ncbi:MAG: hypothetical protein KDA44_04535 [Planctomycetales bacterium]|nr:hypothetical protein [Planctomycetales bacterium]